MTETFIDSKKEVDNQLKKTCEEFIALVTTMLVGPLRDFIDKVWDIFLVNCLKIRVSFLKSDFVLSDLHILMYRILLNSTNT